MKVREAIAVLAQLGLDLDLCYMNIEDRQGEYKYIIFNIASIEKDVDEDGRDIVLIR